MTGNLLPSAMVDKVEELSKLHARQAQNFLAAAFHPAATADPCDRPLSHEAEVSLQLAGKAGRAANKTVQAMTLIGAGVINYGICEDCGENIPEKRLAAVPHATRCVGCQKSAEDAKTPLRLVRQITAKTTRYL